MGEAQTSAEFDRDERPNEARAEGASAAKQDAPETRGQAQGATDAGRAMDKVRDEMAKTKSTNVQALGEIMTALIQARPEIAGAILKDGKTLDGCWKAMEDYARKHKTGNSFAMGPDIAENIIVEYYGMSMPTRVWETEFARGVVKAGEETAPATRAAEPAAKSADMEVTATATPEPDPFDLDALMGAL